MLTPCTIFSMSCMRCTLYEHASNFCLRRASCTASYATHGNQRRGSRPRARIGILHGERFLRACAAKGERAQVYVRRGLCRSDFVSARRGAEILSQPDELQNVFHIRAVGRRSHGSFDVPLFQKGKQVGQAVRGAEPRFFCYIHEDAEFPNGQLVCRIRKRISADDLSPKRTFASPDRRGRNFFHV